jgi:glycosyltransferase involved in cell wall biosynthesis
MLTNRHDQHPSAGNDVVIAPTALKLPRMAGQRCPTALVINGRFLTQPTTGVQRFAIETVKAIDFLLATPQYSSLQGRVELLVPRAARAFPLARIPIRTASFLGGYAWEQMELPLMSRGSILLNLCMLGPAATRWQVVVIHDATVRAVPESYTRAFRAAYELLIPRLCRRAAQIVTVSNFSRQEISRWYGVPLESIAVCSEGSDHITAVKSDVNVLARYNLGGRRFFLGVGGVSRHKNVDTVLKSFSRACLDDTALIITGGRQSRIYVDVEARNSRNVLHIGFVSDAELRALYEHAVALVYPSRYEGFGLPPIEAMACGCPVVISDQPALTETARNAALVCGTHDIGGLAELMQRLVSDPHLRADLAERGRQRAAAFRWSQTAAKLLDLCLDVVLLRSSEHTAQLS